MEDAEVTHNTTSECSRDLFPDSNQSFKNTVVKHNFHVFQPHSSCQKPPNPTSDKKIEFSLYSWPISWILKIYSRLTKIYSWFPLKLWCAAWNSECAKRNSILSNVQQDFGEHVVDFPLCFTSFQFILVVFPFEFSFSLCLYFAFFFLAFPTSLHRCFTIQISPWKWLSGITAFWKASEQAPVHAGEWAIEDPHLRNRSCEEAPQWIGNFKIQN